MSKFILWDILDNHWCHWLEMSIIQFHLIVGTKHHSINMSMIFFLFSCKFAEKKKKSKEHWVRCDFCYHLFGKINVSSLLTLYFFCLLTITVAFTVQTWEQLSKDCWKTNTKLVTPSNHDRSKQSDEPIIRIASNLPV